MGFIRWLNKRLNPNHNWFDYGRIDAFMDNVTTGLENGITAVGNIARELGTQATSYVNGLTGAHLQGRDIEANELSMQNAHDIFQQQVSGMQDAGINPALMYKGASAAPQVQASGATSNMSDLMSAILLKKQASLMDAQANQLNTQADKNAADTENMKLINKYYPAVTESQIQKVLSDIGVNDELIQKYMSEVDLNDLEIDLKEIQKIIQGAQADESSAYFKATRQLAEARTEKEKAAKRELVARAFMEEVEGKFMKDNKFKMGSAEVLAIASAIANVLGVDSGSLAEIFSKSPFRGLWDEFMKRYGKESPAGAAVGGGSR